MNLRFRKHRLDYGNLNVTEAGAQRFAAVSVPAVLRSLVPVVVSAVSEFFFQFWVQTVLHEFRYGFLEEILDILCAADVALLQEFPYFCSSGLLFRTAILSAAHCETCNVVLLFYTASEVYTNFGMASRILARFCYTALYSTSFTAHFIRVRGRGRSATRYGAPC